MKGDWDSWVYPDSNPKPPGPLENLATSPPDGSACQPPASAGLGDVAFGDAQARVGDEVEIPRIRPGKWRICM